MYKKAVDHIKENNITAIEIKSPRVNLSNFVKILDEDMRKDLKSYLSIYGNEKLEVSDISSIIEFNDKDSIVELLMDKEFSKKLLMIP